jgi:hypothetical protein
MAMGKMRTALAALLVAVICLVGAPSAGALDGAGQAGPDRHLLATQSIAF